MALKADKTKDPRDASRIAEEARRLFATWEAEEKSGYAGEISWAEFKREINASRPPRSRPFREE